MKSTELRIGNIIESRTKHPVKANWGTLRALENGEKTYLPIKITEEWLFKLGFEPHSKIGFRRFYNIHTFVIEITHDNVCVYYTDRKVQICFIKYIHELQNLFFALTNTELQCEGF